ncbi:MAG: HIT domain-containing protein [Candidatus Parcubacteria bacterium]|nr:HIT domain-containing protein [Candidatus Parcubacteria bacterium]
MASKKQRVDAENANIVKRSDYTRTLNAIIAGGFCPFCEKHLFKHHRQPIMYKSKHWLVTKNAWPYKGSRFHFLFITRKHVEATEGIAPTAWNDLQKQYRKLIKENNIQGATLMIRSGDTRFTGASVNHLHAHLIVGSLRTENTKPIKAPVGFKK